MTTLIATANVFGMTGLANWFKDLANELQRRRNIKDTIKQLSALTNRELNDIGLARGDIWWVAHQSYPKNKTVAEVNRNLDGWV